MDMDEGTRPSGSGRAAVPVRDRFKGKTWIYRAQLIGCGIFGTLSVVFGALYGTGVMTDAYGEPRPRAALPMAIVGFGMLAAAALAAFNIQARRAPLIRCYLDGIECVLVGVTSLDGV